MVRQYRAPPSWPDRDRRSVMSFRYERVRLRADTTDGDTVIHPTQLLVALLAIHFGKPGERSAWDTAIGAELLLRILDRQGASGNTCPVRST